MEYIGIIILLFIGFLVFLAMSGLFVGGIWEVFGSSTNDPEHGDRNRSRLVLVSFFTVFAVFAWFVGGFAGFW